MSAIQQRHISGQSVDDAIALITSALEAKPGIEEPQYVRRTLLGIVLSGEAPLLAAAEMLACLAAAFVEDLAEATGDTPQAILHALVLDDHLTRP